MKWKVILGAALAVLSLLALYLWESKYEDQVMLTPVLVAATDIEEGQELNLSNLKVIRVTPESKLEKALVREQAELISGKIAKYNISANQQLREEYFVSKEELHPEGLYNFVIPGDWIYSQSVLLGERDFVDIFAMPDRMFLGSYRVDLTYDGTLEILATLSEYFRIFDAINAAGNSLLIAEQGALGIDYE